MDRTGRSKSFIWNAFPLGEERRHRWLRQDACQLFPHARRQVNPGCGKMSYWGRLDGWKYPASACLSLASGSPGKAAVLGDQRDLCLYVRLMCEILAALRTLCSGGDDLCWFIQELLCWKPWLGWE